MKERISFTEEMWRKVEFHKSPLDGKLLQSVAFPVSRTNTKIAL